MTNRKFTEDECIENGGHFWRYYTANQPVDENFNKIGYCFDVYYPNGEPEYRGCPLCGRVEEYISEWRKISK